jgi:ankyrin repeat protein
VFSEPTTETSSPSTTKTTPPLFYAAEVGYADAVALLLQHGAEIGRRNRWGITALMAATWYGNIECVAAMLEAVANVNYRNQYETAFFFSVQFGHTVCAELLLRGGAHINVPVPYQLGSLLHTVAFYGHVNLVDVLIDYGADVEVRDDNGCTSLAAALFWGSNKNGTKLDQVVRRLYGSGCALDFVDSFECQNHGTDVCYCVELIEELFAMQGSGEEGSYTALSLVGNRYG